MNAYDVLCFNETWLEESITDSLLINNSLYSIVRHDRNGKTGGGILVLVKKRYYSVCYLSLSIYS